MNIAGYEEQIHYGSFDSDFNVPNEQNKSYRAFIDEIDSNIFDEKQFNKFLELDILAYTKTVGFTATYGKGIEVKQYCLKSFGFKVFDFEKEFPP